jgi:hypothetical protein
MSFANFTTLLSTYNKNSMGILVHQGLTKYLARTHCPSQKDYSLTLTQRAPYPLQMITPKVVSKLLVGFQLWVYALMSGSFLDKKIVHTKCMSQC